MDEGLDVTREAPRLAISHDQQLRPSVGAACHRLDDPHAAPSVVVQGGEVALDEIEPFEAVGAVGVDRPARALTFGQMDGVGHDPTDAVSLARMEPKGALNHGEGQGADGEVGAQ